MLRSVLAATLLSAVTLPAAADEKPLWKDGQRVVFLGDSNTYAGRFIVYLDAFQRTRFPQTRVELLNLGLPSETVSGQSEPDHPYPRPDVHERLDRVLARLKPDVVVACYGMNDGIYYPFAQERQRKYEDGMLNLIARVQKTGARVILHTPAPFDPRPLKTKVLPATAEKFSWMRPYQDYDGVLTRFSDWLLTLREKGFVVANPHLAINRYLAEVRKEDPDYRISGDGIHPDATGHFLIAQELLRALDAPGEADGVEINLKDKKAVRGKVTDLAITADEVRWQWTSKLPLAADPQWDRRLAQREKIAERWNRYRLVVREAPARRYELFEGTTKLGEVTAEQLAAGVDLLAYPALSSNRAAAEVLKKTAARQELLARAWLTEVGHKRPDTPKGLPLKEAQAKADALEKELRELAGPRTIQLRLVAKAE